MSYTMTRERLRDVYAELEPLYKEHYAAMAARLAENGVPVSPYKPNLVAYFRSDDDGRLLTFVLRHDGEACGYINVYVVPDNHNGDLIAQEDVLYVTPKHRGGTGKNLVKFGLDELRKMGVKRLNVAAGTDLRVIPLWKRMGFKEVAMQMTYVF